MSHISDMSIVATPEENSQLVYQACLYNNAELLEDLLRGDLGSQLEWRDAQGNSAMHIAASSGHIECLKILIRANGHFH